MRVLLSVKQSEAYRQSVDLVQHKNGELSLYGGVVSINFKESAAHIVIWLINGKAEAYLDIRLFCQHSADKLISVSLDLSIEQALALHAALPEMDFHDEREQVA